MTLDEARNIVRDFIEEARGFPTDGDWFDLRPTQTDLSAMEAILNPDIVRLCRNCGHWYPEIERDLSFCQEFLCPTNALFGCKQFYEKEKEAICQKP